MARAPFHSLYFKIFATFLVAQLALALVLGLYAAAVARAFEGRFNRAASDALGARAIAAAVALELGGPAALKRAWTIPSETSNDEPFGFGNSPNRRGSPDDFAGATLFAVSRRGKLERLVGPPIAAQWEPVLEEALSAGSAQSGESKGRALSARRVQTATGRVFLAAMTIGNLGRPPSENPLSALLGRSNRVERLTLALLVLGAICWLLTRILTAPLRSLQNATRAIAEGDFHPPALQKSLKRRDEIGDLSRDMSAMAGQIESLLENERRLRSDISHELRSPLARIGVALDLAGQTADPKTSINLARIRDESNELGALISGLLSLSRLENAAHLAPEAAYLDLGALVSHVVQTVALEADARGVELKILELVPLQTRGDGQLLHSAVENIVRNAILHGAATPCVEVRLRAQDEKTALLSVRDFGPGVPETELANIFRPFFRVQSARDRESGGTGLGLSIAQRAVEACGGSIAAFNAEGGGLLVEIQLPIWRDNQNLQR